MLIQTEHRNILIDTGIGDYHGDKFENRFGVVGDKNPLIQLLKSELNLGPSEITDLIISHLHFDHVGGLGSDDATEAPAHALLFPEATLHVHRQHFEYALHPTDRDAGSFHTQYFKALLDAAEARGKVHWLEGAEGLILTDNNDKIFFKCSFGHTPYLIHAWDEKFIYMADLVPTSHHIPVPWVMGYDIAPGQTTKDKKDFYQFISQEKKTMIFEHDMAFWGADIGVRNGDPEVLQRFPVSDKKVMEIFN